METSMFYNLISSSSAIYNTVDADYVHGIHLLVLHEEH